MMDTIKAVFDWLTFVYLHPAVTAVVLAVIALGRLRFEVPLINKAKFTTEEAIKAAPDIAKNLSAYAKECSDKADKAGNIVFLVACAIAVAAQFSFYWPTSGQGRAICFVMSILQVCMAQYIYVYADKWGLMDRLGKIVQKKMDNVGGQG